ncbi:polyprenyl synthetase family protein [Endozoicomonas sp. SCSIO W0465]|uniref:polyprenyl synthetase family protein n=1 Tax=Endozoicomonas sp. SCSIO W0465 TaxID=2918516 RepID=UPI0020760989|nr:farnesyl diphosphate synthase [Endozoicomonas sp. SCSIO W0465]USE37583.1 polyprenyl synthetase family protein [Endozoicomonas sp. SCSIO W0465]
MAIPVSLSIFVEQCRLQVDNVLSTVLPDESKVSPLLLEAMRYSVFNGGKRVRPALVYAACHALGGMREQADPAACAVELIHAYSLVHDDLPAMDDDDLRRGKPTCHKAYDEATAILVGDTLQSQAFEVLGNARLCPESTLTDSVRLQLVTTLSQASGLAGMAGGQAMDQCATGSVLDRQQLELMHTHKTGALIRASVRMGALCARPLQDDELKSLDHYARSVGLAFQVRDDILDVTADTETLGKHQGADMALNKPTYVSLMGLEQARAYAEELHHSAISALTGFDHSADFLRQIADYIVRRSY